MTFSVNADDGSRKQRLYFCPDFFFFFVREKSAFLVFFVIANIDLKMS